MRVYELIKELKKQDRHAEVVWADNDQSEHEYNNEVRLVEKACDELHEQGIGVVLRPYGEKS